MRAVLSFVFVLCCFAGARAQDATSGDVRASEPRVPLDAQAAAYDIYGRTALAARLRTTTLVGTTDAPERNTRIVVENRSPVFYTYASGWATFYGADNVRCGEGMWKLEALAPGESAEVETPGLRLTCTPATWRIVALNLLTRTTDAAKPADETAAPPAETVTPTQPDAATPPTTTTTTAPSTSAATSSSTSPAARTLPPLEINVNGRVIPIQPGNPLEITVGAERVRIILQPVP
jgi:hypothetical protein